ncbi:MAG: ADP-ribosylglycohydrolase family protein [Erysipelotrichaceae bacterium]|nr:ADP-ribosylglycohydrolase family protein [Erysipelotrichaceae bacterium]
MINKIRGCIVGGAIGDALGYPIEFDKDIKDKQQTRFDGIGYFSDDTQMTLFTAEGLIYQKNHDISYEEAIYQAYLDWYDTQNSSHMGKNICKIKNYPELNYSRAPGITCLNALSSGKIGTIDHPLNDSKGCGSVMRVAPAGIVCDSISEAGKVGAIAGAITHSHPLGIIPCYVFSAMIYELIHSDKTIVEALDIAMQDYLDGFDIFDQESKDTFVSLINKAKELSQQDINDIDAINQLGEGWVAEEALAIAIYACLKYDDFADVIICAVNHDGDSDSTGAIAGNIIGAYLGYDHIPDYYKDHIEAKHILLEISDALESILKL